MITIRMVRETLYEICRDGKTIVWLDDKPESLIVKGEIERLEARIADLEKTVDDLRLSDEAD